MARTTPKVHSGGQRGGVTYSGGAVGIGIAGTATQAPQPQQPTNQTATDDEEDVIINQQNEDEVAEDEVDHDEIDWDGKQFPQLTDQQYDKIYSDNRDSYKNNGNIINAKQMYQTQNAKSPQMTVGNAYNKSWSQDLNHRLNHDLKLDTDSQFMHTYLSKALHPIGQDCTMYRAAHSTVIDSLLKKSGFSTYDKMSDKQLKSALVGATAEIKSYGSWSTNPQKNPFMVGVNSGGREVEIIARTSSGTKVFCAARSQTEVVTGAGQKMRITDVKTTRRSAFTSSGQSKPIIQLYVDLW